MGFRELIVVGRDGVSPSLIKSGAGRVDGTAVGFSCGVRDLIGARSMQALRGKDGRDGVSPSQIKSGAGRVE